MNGRDSTDPYYTDEFKAPLIQHETVSPSRIMSEAISDSVPATKEKRVSNSSTNDYETSHNYLPKTLSGGVAISEDRLDQLIY